MFDLPLSKLEIDLRTGGAAGTCVTELIGTARVQLDGALAEVVKERANGIAEVAKQRSEVAKERATMLADVAEERAKELTEVDARRAELRSEIAAMHTHKETQQGRVELNVGGKRFETSVQTLRRIPHTFFDSYFSGQYAQDVCADGSIFVDRDGEHFSHVLEYMRDGHLSVAEPSARPSLDLLLALRREFDFFSFELPVVTTYEQLEAVFVVGGEKWAREEHRLVPLSGMEQYDASSGQWSMATGMSTVRRSCGACVITGELFVSSGQDSGRFKLSSVEKYTPSTDTWCTMAPLPDARSSHAAVAVGSAMYVLGGFIGIQLTTSVLKYDSTQSTWREVTPMPEERTSFAACAVGSDIFVFGGWGDGDVHASVFKYNTVADTWSTLAPMPQVCAGCASVLNGLIYIFDAICGKEVLRYDPASGEWSAMAPTSNDHCFGCSFVMGEFLYVAGGAGTIDSISSVERYEVASDTWAPVMDMLCGRSKFAAVTIEFAGPAEEQDLFESLIAEGGKRELA
jgi:hypothetical protein